MVRLNQHARGNVRDAIVTAIRDARRPLGLTEIQNSVESRIGPTPESSIRSYLQDNTPETFVRFRRGTYGLKGSFDWRETSDHWQAPEPFRFGNAQLYHCDCFRLIAQWPDNSVHAVVTDPPYGLHEYSPEQQTKLREGRGGVWRIPPSFDGHVRSPLPRFTTLTFEQLEELHSFFAEFARILLPKLVPGANVVIASNPLLSYIVSSALAEAGLERRGEIVRLVMTMRGGDRPKDAHREFSGVSVMPRSMWEPWLVYRKIPDGRIQDCLRKWKTGGFRRPSSDRPFGDVIQSAPTRPSERAIAAHPSLKPQAFMRQLVRGVLPLGEGVVLDPFAGAGSTLAAAESVGYKSVGIEMDQKYYSLAMSAFPELAALKIQTADQHL